MIQPTVGRVVNYFPGERDHILALTANMSGDHLAAVVTAVWNERSVNLCVFDASGNTHGRVSVRLLQEDDEPIEGAPHAAWMEFQRGQAQRTQALEQQLAEQQAQ